MTHWIACWWDIWWVVRWIAPFGAASLFYFGLNTKEEFGGALVVLAVPLYIAAVTSLAWWQP